MTGLGFEVPAFFHGAAGVREYRSPTPVVSHSRFTSSEHQFGAPDEWFTPRQRRRSRSTRHRAFAAFGFVRDSWRAPYLQWLGSRWHKVLDQSPQDHGMDEHSGAQHAWHSTCSKVITTQFGATQPVTRLLACHSVSILESLNPWEPVRASFSERSVVCLSERCFADGSPTSLRGKSLGQVRDRLRHYVSASHLRSTWYIWKVFLLPNREFSLF